MENGRSAVDTMSTDMDMQHEGNDLGSSNNGIAGTAAYIQNKLNQVSSDLVYAGHGKEAVIYRVPQNLRVSNTEAYTPKLVSIGPYHHGSTDLQPWEAIKCAAVRDLCKLTNVTLVQLVQELDQQVKEPRNYYRQNIDMVGDEELSALLLIDGCFLFNYLGGLQPFTKKTEEKPDLQHVYSVDSGIQRDIFLLENQVPFAVLNAIGSAISACHNGKVDIHVKKLVFGFTEGVLQYIPTAVMKPEQLKNIRHLVDLCYQYLYPTSLSTRRGHHEIPIPQGGNDGLPEVRRLRRASEYRETGIRFMLRTQRPISLLDITFSRGVLRIPRLVVDERTTNYLRNIIAYEQESFNSRASYVTAYVLFMSQLMSKAEDVTLLSEKGILVHQLGSDEEVSDMFRKMTKGVVFDFNGEYHLKDETVALEKHYRDCRNRWTAQLRHTYFSNPWLILGAVVAMVAFALSVSQAALNFLRFARNPK